MASKNSSIELEELAANESENESEGEGIPMSFNFANSVVSLAAGKSITINYWLNAGALMGPAMATFYPYLSTCKGLYATGQGVSYSYEKDKYIYHVKIANFGTETQAFQIWGGILP